MKIDFREGSYIVFKIINNEIIIECKNVSIEQIEKAKELYLLTEIIIK